jgi:hypothetical protein
MIQNLKVKRIIYRISPWSIGLIILATGSCSMFQSTPVLQSEKLRFTVASINETLTSGQLRENDDPLLVNPADQVIRLYAAGGETVAFQIIIPAKCVNTGTPLRLNIKSLNLYRPDETAEKYIEKIRWRIYRLHSIDIGQPDSVMARQEPALGATRQRCFDAMEELNFDSPGVVTVQNESSDDEALVLWVEAEIPLHITRATYCSQIELKNLQNNNETFTKELHLHTWGFDLPDSGIDFIARIDVPKLWQDSGLGTLRDSDQLILPPDESRINLLAERLGEYTALLDESGVETWPAGVYPKIVASGNDHYAIEWDSYRKMIQSVLSHSSHARKYWPVPVDISYPQTQVYGPYESESYQQILNMLLREFNEKCVKLGLIGKPAAIPFLPDGYNDAVNAYDSVHSLMKAWFNTESNMLLVSPFIPGDLRPLGWRAFVPFDKVNSMAGGFCCGETWLDPSVVDTLRKKGNCVWFRPMNSEGTLPWPRVGYPGFYSQAMAWAAWKYGMNGVLFDSVNDWSEEDRLPLQNRLIYPSGMFNCNKPLGSVRLKLLQRGLFDAAYMRALEKTGEKELADWIGMRLVRYAFADAYEGSLWTLRTDGLCNNDRAWMLPKLIAGFTMNDTIAKQTTTVPASQRAESDQSDLLRKLYISQFREYTEGLALESEGVRARYISDPSTGRENIEWTFHLAGRNFTGETVEGKYECITSPMRKKKNSESLQQEVKFNGNNWGWPVRQQLTLNNPVAALGMFGVNYQPIVFKRKDRTETILNVRYCALVAGRTVRQIRVDGIFNDWPENSSAVAGNFKKIHSDGLNADRMKDESRDVQYSTTVQIGYDDRNMYLAFTCTQPRESIHMQSSNTLTSSEGLPWGEDLIAVVINPKNTASQNPLDAYQIIIKPNGNILTFRGTLTTKQLHAADSWTNNICSAVRIFDDRWQAEIAIPLTDLSVTETLGCWWGLDFARYTSSVNEFSTWSGTAHGYSRPISLGNVFFAR